MWIETALAMAALHCWAKFIRQQWRMWIETHDWLGIQRSLGKFIRQQWRMWIETVLTFFSACRQFAIHSPAMANVD